MAESLTPFDTSPGRMVSTAPGVWEIEGDLYEISPSPSGGMKAVDPSGNPISAVFVMGRGRKVSDPVSTAPGPETPNG